MAEYTRTYFKNIYNTNRNYFELRKREIVTESKLLTPKFDIFLSHSFLDKEEINGIFIYLSLKGFKVYVDWVIDQNLDRNSINKNTAKTIRKRLSQSKTLFHATSSNAVNSKWMPWETGIMDGLTTRCAIIEVLNHSSSIFNRQEYLLLYPRVLDSESNSSKEVLIINRETSKMIPYSLWQKGQNP